MREYQPWDNSWREQIVYIMVPKEVDAPVEMRPDFMYPLFVGAFERRLKGDDFWRAVASAMVIVIGHDPCHQRVKEYVYWLNAYNPRIVQELVFNGVNQASSGNYETAVWLFQAAVLLAPGMAESHFNLGLAFGRIGQSLTEANKVREADDCFKQALKYLGNAVELDPKLSLAYYNMGFIYKHLGLADESRKYLEKGMLLGVDNQSQQHPF